MRRKRFRARIIGRRKSAARKFYRPVERGFEREIKKRLEYWEKLRKERGQVEKAKDSQSSLRVGLRGKSSAQEDWTRFRIAAALADEATHSSSKP